MRYEDFLINNDPNDAGDPVSIDIHTWETDGARIIGELKEITDFEGGEFEQKCKRYIFKTDKGLVSTILGSSVDKQISPEKYIGRVLCITYNGQISLKDGRRCNRFTVVDVTDAFRHWEKKPIEAPIMDLEGPITESVQKVKSVFGGKDAKDKH
jgi:hypothetical protein